MLRLRFEKVCVEEAKVVPCLEDAGEPVTLSQILGALLQDWLQLFVALKSSLVVECQAERRYISNIGRERVNTSSIMIIKSLFCIYFKTKSSKMNVVPKLRHLRGYCSELLQGG